MESMEQSVQERCHEQPGRRKENETGEKRIGAREKLAGGGMKFIDRAHPAENHRRVEEGIDPGEFLQLMIAEHADRQSHPDYAERGPDVTGKAHEKRPQRQEGLATMLEKNPHLVP